MDLLFLPVSLGVLLLYLCLKELRFIAGKLSVMQVALRDCNSSLNVFSAMSAEASENIQSELDDIKELNKLLLYRLEQINDDTDIIAKHYYEYPTNKD